MPFNIPDDPRELLSYSKFTQVDYEIRLHIIKMEPEAEGPFITKFTPMASHKVEFVVDLILQKYKSVSEKVPVILLSGLLQKINRTGIVGCRIANPSDLKALKAILAQWRGDHFSPGLSATNVVRLSIMLTKDL